ncbi:MAG: HD domain-containing protein [Candidatus Micrarchaeota archaeon]
MEIGGRTEKRAAKWKFSNEEHSQLNELIKTLNDTKIKRWDGKEREKLESWERKLVGRAFIRALIVHEGHLRDSGEKYFNHPYQTALELAGNGGTAEQIASALLHDTLERETGTGHALVFNDLHKEFGGKIALSVALQTKQKYDKEKDKWVLPSSNRYAKTTHYEGATVRERAEIYKLREQILVGKLLRRGDMNAILAKMYETRHNISDLQGVHLDISDTKLETYLSKLKTTYTKLKERVRLFGEITHNHPALLPHYFKLKSAFDEMNNTSFGSLARMSLEKGRKTMQLKKKGETQD